MKHNKIFAAFLTLASAATLVSCVDTETVESPDVGKAGDGIVVEILSPKDATTRASQGYKLRYVAEIYQGLSTSDLGTLIDRKEITGTPNADDSNQIVFKVDPEAYTIIVFADYIPDSFTATSNRFNDYFFNTQGYWGGKNYKGTMLMRFTPESDKQNLAADFFNNDNYDCFFGRATVNKTQNEERLRLELQRAVALVELKDNTSAVGEYSVQVKSLESRTGFSLNDQATNRGAAQSGVTFTSQMSSPNQDVISFYVFADDKTDNQNASINFLITHNGETQDFRLMNIPVQRNYKTVVTGSYMKKSNQSSGDVGGGGADSPKVGDIILNLSASENWSGVTSVSMSQFGY